MTEGSLEVKLRTIWTDGKSNIEKQRWREKKKEDPGAPKGRKVAKQCVFPKIWGSGGSKSRLAKTAGAEPLGRWDMKNWTPLWCEAHFEVKMPKTPHVRRSFGSGNVGKKRTPLWREAYFEVKSVKTYGFGALLEVRRRKSARGCGAKRVLKPK